jgi:hypothetical protein
MITSEQSFALATAGMGVVLLFGGAYLSRANKKLAQAMAFAGFIIAVSLAVVLLSHAGWASAYVAELSKRSMGVLMGAMVVFFANAVPKQTGSARRQSALRVCGWSLVLGGLGFSAAWLFVPFAYADIVAMALLASSLLYAIVRIALICSGRQSISPPSA